VWIRRNPWLLLSVALVAIASGYFAWSNRLAEKWSGGGALEKAGQVRVERGSPRAMPYTLEDRGELQPLKSINVVTGLSGVVKELRYKVGDWVSQGAIVATIEPKELLRRVASIEASLTAARSQLAEKERQLVDAQMQREKIEALVKQDFLAKREIDAARFAADAARAEVDLGIAHVAQQEAMLAESRKLLGLSRLTAPFNGLVTAKMVEPGSAIADGTAILTIASIDILRVTIRVPQPHANVVSEGMSAEVHIGEANGEVFEGKVTRLVSGPESSGEILAEVQLANRDHRLKPGTTVSVLIRPLSPTS
jgi:RND family efflux transporter MFP subunit